ncbi:MAG: molybdopterin molybdenumtransferase MoeA, partial [Bacteroidota bacterium]|nr:molybdopterin molybdenumtransferase MoeA [Bacteroidota bacterium]
VSTFITFYKYCIPWLKRHMGVQNLVPIQAILKSDVAFNPPLTYFLQVKVQIEEGRIMAVPYSGKGSGDLANLSDCDGFIELTSEETSFKAGDSFPIVLFKNIIFR